MLCELLPKIRSQPFLLAVVDLLHEAVPINQDGDRNHNCSILARCNDKARVAQHRLGYLQSAKKCRCSIRIPVCRDA